MRRMRHLQWKSIHSYTWWLAAGLHMGYSNMTGTCQLVGSRCPDRVRRLNPLITSSRLTCIPRAQAVLDHFGR